ncbi:MAG TPA: UDP-glucose/GDP-mannose dehydrogenase family protein [Candidatus Margulisiibacteriota bacterium]|nr:UDP-glucose/GDP-mannose dehydrogenase family protein [Candidatus Margulisiibacteriota bacterium]
MNISVVGLGKLGSPLAAVLAHKGHTVIGVDMNPRNVELINQGKAPVFEPGLDEYLHASRDRLSATTDLSHAVRNSEVTFIIVPTPSHEEGAFSLRYVLAALEAIGAALRDKHDFHLVVLTSTVMPGATGNEVLPALERHSGKRCGRDFGLCYNPEFIALGSVIHDMLHPDVVLIGESDVRSGDILVGIHHSICENTPPVARMNFVNAELTKLAVNTFVTTKISYANMLAQVCERLPGADVDVVTSALGLDSRIGRKYLKGALGYGGPCFPRDNQAFAHLARTVGVHAAVAEATDAQNRQQVQRLAEAVHARLPANGRVGVLGLSYKPNTDVVEESQGLELARHLHAHGVAVVVYDPAAADKARSIVGDGIVFAASAVDCARQVDVIVITTAWDEFRALSAEHLNSANGRPTVIDCWRVLDPANFGDAAHFVALGTGPRLDGHQSAAPQAAAREEWVDAGRSPSTGGMQKDRGFSPR